jgi:hypothetical protein
MFPYLVFLLRRTRKAVIILYPFVGIPKRPYGFSRPLHDPKIKNRAFNRCTVFNKLPATAKKDGFVFIIPASGEEYEGIQTVQSIDTTVEKFKQRTR